MWDPAIRGRRGHLLQPARHRFGFRIIIDGSIPGSRVRDLAIRIRFVLGVLPELLETIGLGIACKQKARAEQGARHGNGGLDSPVCVRGTMRRPSSSVLVDYGA